MPKQYKLLNNPEDTESNPLTWDRLMAWLADTGYIEGLVGKRISPLDRAYLEDYIQEVWVQILEVPPEKMMEIYRRGKGKFVNYLKSIVMNNIYSGSSHLYKNLRAGQHELVHLDDVGWRHLEDDQDVEITLSFPTITKEKGLMDRVSFEYEKISTHSENKLYDE